MSNPMRYIKDLEAAGFERKQAEAQVQMVLDAIEGDLATKVDLNELNSELKSEVRSEATSFRSEFASLRSEFAALRADMALFKEQIQKQILEIEFRLVTRLGLLIVSTTSIAVAILTWLIKL